MEEKPNAGFTLIELLVVIAIIAILAAILFPTFMSAKESGRRTACLGNLKQLGTALQMYAEQYNGYYPATRPSNWPWGDWDTRPPWGEKQLGLRAIIPFIKNKAVFFCPSNNYWTKQRYNSFWNNVPVYTGTLNYYCGYAYYGAYFAQDDSGATFLAEGQVAVNTGRYPRALLLSDIIATCPGMNNSVNSHSAREIEGGNLFYNDGHAKWKRTSEMQPLFKRAGFQFYW